MVGRRQGVGETPAGEPGIIPLTHLTREASMADPDPTDPPANVPPPKPPRPPAPPEPRAKVVSAHREEPDERWERPKREEDAEEPTKNRFLFSALLLVGAFVLMVVFFVVVIVLKTQFSGPPTSPRTAPWNPNNQGGWPPPGQGQFK